VKTITNITLYDLMAEDMDVWITRNKDFGYNLQIDDENGDTLIDDSFIHPCAAESLADFCRRYLNSYDKQSHTD
jgi:hypothetical protein